MLGEEFLNECVEILLTVKQMFCNPMVMILQCLWIVVTCREEQWIKNAQQLAENDRTRSTDTMPDELLHGIALTVRCRLCFIRVGDIKMILGTRMPSVVGRTFGIEYTILDILLEIRTSTHSLSSNASGELDTCRVHHTVGGSDCSRPYERPNSSSDDRERSDHQHFVAIARETRPILGRQFWQLHLTAIPGKFSIVH